jgi:hypothetical protein
MYARKKNRKNQKSKKSEKLQKKSLKQKLTPQLPKKKKLLRAKVYPAVVPAK